MMIINAIEIYGANLCRSVRSSPISTSKLKYMAIVFAAIRPIWKLCICSSGRFGTTSAMNRIKKSMGVLLKPCRRENLSVNRIKRTRTDKRKVV